MSFILKRFTFRRSPHWLFLLFFALSAVILIWASSKFFRMQDEGMLVTAAMGVASGKVLYRDLFEFWTPLSVYLTAGAISIFGLSIEMVRILAVLTILIASLGFYIVIDQISQNRFFAALSAIYFVVTTYSFAEMNHHWLGMLFLFGTLLSLTKLIQTKQYSWAIVSGAMASLTFLSMQLEGAIALSLSLISLIIWFRDKADIKIWLNLGVASLVPILLVVGYFGFQQGIDELFYSVIVFPLTQYRSTNGEFASAAQLAQIIILIGSIHVWNKYFHSIQAKLWLITAILIQALLLFSGNTGLSTRYSFFFGVIVIGCILMMLKSGYFQRLKKTFDHPRGYFQFLRLLTLGLLLCIASSNTLSETFAAWRSIALSNQPIHTPSGTLYARSEIAPKAQSIVSYINQNTSINEPVYFGPFSSYYHFLTQRPSPTKYSQLTPKYNPPWMFEEAVEQLRESQVSTIVLLPQENPFAFNEENQLAQYVIQNYQVAQTLPFATLLSSKKIYHGSYKRQLTNQPTDAIWVVKE